MEKRAMLEKDSSAVNLSYPRQVVNARRDQLMAANNKCAVCGEPVHEAHQGTALFINSRQRWELVHAMAGRGCDWEMIYSLNARKLAGARV